MSDQDARTMTDSELFFALNRYLKASVPTDRRREIVNAIVGGIDFIRDNLDDNRSVSTAILEVRRAFRIEVKDIADTARLDVYLLENLDKAGYEYAPTSLILRIRDAIRQIISRARPDTENEAQRTTRYLFVAAFSNGRSSNDNPPFFLSEGDDDRRLAAR